MKRMHSWQKYNPLPDLLDSIPESGLKLSDSAVVNICEIFAKGGILVECVQDLSLVLSILDKEYNLIYLEDNILKKVKYG